MALPRLLVILAALLAGVAVVPADAPARTGRCLAAAKSPACHFWAGKATFVADGDTVDVDIAGDGTHRPRRVRLVGVNAMEQSRYSKYASRRRGACHALAATAYLETLIGRSGGRVRLAAQDPGSRSGRRLRRQLSVRVSGRWVDAAELLLRRGHALWLPNHAEWAFNSRHRRAALAAARAGRRLYDPDACGPTGHTPVKLTIEWDAPGNDFANPNGEWARVTNPGARPLPVDGWWFRDSALRRFTFPAGTVIAPGGQVTVHMGRGTARAGEFFWGQGAVFENAGVHGVGDGGYLFDRRGNLRAWTIYPA